MIDNVLFYRKLDHVITMFLSILFIFQPISLWAQPDTPYAYDIILSESLIEDEVVFSIKEVKYSYNKKSLFIALPKLDDLTANTGYGYKILMVDVSGNTLSEHFYNSARVMIVDKEVGGEIIMLAEAESRIILPYFSNLSKIKIVDNSNKETEFPIADYPILETNVCIKLSQTGIWNKEYCCDDYRPVPKEDKFICINCGDGECADGENIINCLVDCQANNQPHPTPTEEPTPTLTPTPTEDPIDVKTCACRYKLTKCGNIAISTNTPELQRISDTEWRSAWYDILGPYKQDISSGGGEISQKLEFFVYDQRQDRVVLREKEWVIEYRNRTVNKSNIMYDYDDYFKPTIWQVAGAKSAEECLDGNYTNNCVVEKSVANDCSYKTCDKSGLVVKQGYGVDTAKESSDCYTSTCDYEKRRCKQSLGQAPDYCENFENDCTKGQCNKGLCEEERGSNRAIICYFKRCVGFTNSDFCKADKDCRHYACDSTDGECKEVLEPGKDTCNPNFGARCWHMGCVGQSCERINTPGDITCYSEKDCLASPSPSPGPTGSPYTCMACGCPGVSC